MRTRRWQSALFGLLAAVGCARGTLKMDDELLPELDDDTSPATADAAPDAPADGPGEVADAGPWQPPDDPDPPDPPDPDEPDGALPDGDPDAGPPASGECVAGTYSGSFSGKITALFVVNIDIQGSIEIDALNAGSGDVLTIDQGKVTGTDTDGNPVTADVTGTLDCKTKQLMNGQLANGVYVRKNINQTVNFAGTAQAVYAPGNPPTVTGVWQTSGGIEMGSGNFSATLKQP